MAKKVLLSGEIHPDGMRLLEERGMELTIAPNDQEETLSALARDVDGIIVRAMTKITKIIIDAAKSCKVIGRHGVGLDTIDMQAATEAKIPVVNTPGVNRNAVAEHAVCLTLALAKQLCLLNTRLKDHGDYNYRKNIACFELTGKTAGIIGLGRIGSRVAEIFQRGFEMKIFGYDPYIQKEALEKKGLDVNLTCDIKFLLSSSDIITLHLPAADNTPIIGREELALMKEEVLFINTARGTLVDEKALYEALSNRRIAGAGLDAFELEPPLADNPLFSLDNVVVTPHTGGMTRDSLRNMAIRVCKNVTAVLNGEKPEDLVNPEIWSDRRI